MTVLEQIKNANTNRDTRLLVKKYNRMAEGLHLFFRATSSVFYHDFAQYFNTEDPTRVWGCGDLHLQNFGTYKADNRMVYFDINDFDDAILLPATWELGRMLTSIYLASEELDLEKNESKQLVTAFLDSYTKTLSAGKPIDIERRTATGMLNTFFEILEKRRRRDFIKERTIKTDTGRVLNFGIEKVLPTTDAQRNEVETNLQEWLKKHPNPFFQRICDIGIRLTGTASLGLERYVVLVENHKEKFYLLDLKEARISTLASLVALPQPTWPTEADRIVQIQSRVNNVLPPYLALLFFQIKLLLLKSYSPNKTNSTFTCTGMENWSLWKIFYVLWPLLQPRVICVAGRQGSSIADELITFAQKTQWQHDLNTFAPIISTRYIKIILLFARHMRKASFMKD
ncbi:MAG: DUF2252 family protein [Spirosomataceae bacterium]